MSVVLRDLTADGLCRILGRSSRRVEIGDGLAGKILPRSGCHDPQFSGWVDPADSGGPESAKKTPIEWSVRPC